MEDKLKSPETATTVRLDRGEPIVTDGPFVEGKEVVSGYTEIEVADLDEALQMGDLAGLPARGDPPDRTRSCDRRASHASWPAWSATTRAGWPRRWCL